MDIIRMNCQFHDKWILHFALTLTKNLQFSRSSKRVQCHIGKADSSEGLAKHKQSFVHLWNICCYIVIEKKRSEVFFFLVSPSSHWNWSLGGVQHGVKNWPTELWFQFSWRDYCQKRSSLETPPIFLSIQAIENSRCWWPELKYGRRMELFIASRSAD